MNPSADAPLLFTPLAIRGFTAPNRVLVSPMLERRINRLLNASEASRNLVARGLADNGGGTLG